jgi:hypothetical protein
MINIIKLLKNYYFIAGVIIILIGAILFCLIPRVDMHENYASILLSFVGILATFIVIGNYAQVKDIESKFDRKMVELNNKITDQNRIKKELDEIKDSLTEAVANVNNINADLNCEKQFFLNAIHNYIETVKRLSNLQKNNIEFLQPNMDTLLELVNLQEWDNKRFSWENYDFNKSENFDFNRSIAYLVYFQKIYPEFSKKTEEILSGLIRIKIIAESKLKTEK